MSFLLFRSILRPASKDPEAHEGVGENRANDHSHEFGGIAPQLYRISSARMMTKRTTSRRVVRCLRLNVQYLFKKKLVTAPLL